MDRIMRGAKCGIATDVRGHDNLTRRSLCTDYVAFIVKRPHDLNAEVNLHHCSTIGGMMIEKAIMPVYAQALVAAEKLPDEIERRLPCLPNGSNAYTSPHCGERL